MNDTERELDMALADAEQENRLLRARNERLMIEVQLLSEAVRAQRNWIGMTTDEIFAELSKIDEHTKRLPKGLADFAYAPKENVGNR